MAKKADGVLGAAREVEPVAALVEEIERTAGHVSALGAIVAAIPKDQLVEGVTKVVEVEGSGEDGSGAYRTVTTETAPNIWLRLYQAERKHLLDAVKTAHSCGVEMRAPEEEADAVNDIAAQRAKRLAGVSRAAD